MEKLHTETVGSGKPIVMVHGWAMHSGIWRDFALELANSYRITRVDLPGHGHSPPIVPFSLETACGLLDEIIPHEPCCWLGWSLGAAIAIAMANRYPARVNRLILLAGTPCFVRKVMWPGMRVEVLEGFAGNLAQDSQETLLRFLSLQLKGEQDYKKSLHALKQSILERPAPNPHALRDGLAILKEADLREAFKSLAIPVHAILGELDTLVPVAVGQAMQSLLPGLDLVVIPRVGHVPFLSHQQDVLAAINRFMEG